MPITQHSILPSRRGEADAQNYKKRVHRQISEYIKKKIGEKDIITGKGKVYIPVKGTKRYRFIFDRNLSNSDESGNGAGQGPGEELYEVWLDMEEVEEMIFQELDLPRLKPKQLSDSETEDIKWDSYAVHGPSLDKKATLKHNLTRNAAQGTPGVGTFDKSDLRYTSYHETPKPKSKAVVFLMMDVSGSMGPFHKRIARLFFYWTVRFLRHRYDNVDVRFIAHTTEAKEVTENEFFNRVATGGTFISSAYKLALRMQREQYPINDWNIYVLHASDGDNWQLDNEECFKVIHELCQVASLVGYIEIKEPKRGPLSWSTLMDDLGERRHELGPEFMLTYIKDDKEIWPALKTFFAKEDIESSVV